jgi:TonB family protein
MSGTSKSSTLLSVLIHLLAIALILIATSVRQHPFTPLVPARDSVIYLPPIAAHGKGGGGGGFHSNAPASEGHPPKPARRMILPPLVSIQERQPQLAVEPTVLAPVDTPLPKYEFPQIGSPNGVDEPPSNGRGARGGFGEGDNGGIGDRRGPGIGDGPGGPGGGGSNDPNRFKPPVVIVQHEPEYSQDARKAKLQGSVLLKIVVSASGQVTDIQVLRPLGMGLDDRAIEAVRQWKFRPATLDGKPVAATATVDVSFRLL